MSVNPQTGNIAAYSGRKVDILAFPGARRSGSVQLAAALTLPGDGGWLCTGIQSLAQRWVIGFLTPYGSVPYEPLRGTEFVASARGGRLRTEQAVRSEFGAAMTLLGAWLVNAESADDPDDERYSSEDLLAVGIDPAAGRLTLRVRLLSVAGAAREIILPVRTTAGVV